MAEKLTAEEAVSRMQAFIDFHAGGMPDDNFDTALNRAIEVQSAVIRAPGVNARAIFAFRIPRQYSNTPAGPQTSHGGAIATFFDITTSMAIVPTCFPGWESLGVSRNLNVTYFKPPVEGDDVVVEAEVLSIGKRLATIQGALRRESDGVLLATCHHDRYLSTRHDEGKL